MPQVILQPSGSQVAREHYQNTVANPVPITQMARYLPEADVALLQTRFPEGSVPTWGVTPGERDVNRHKWERVRNGAILLFASERAIRATGVVVHKLHNRDLALQLWKTDEDGDTWEYMYFVDQVEPCDVPYARFNAAAEYKTNFVIQSFQVLKEEKSARILSVLDLGTGNVIAGTLEDYEAAISLDPNAPLDAVGQALLRKEQGFLRRQLFGKRRTAICAICGRTWPTDLLVAAHIKKRSHCSLEEKRDFRNNVAAMCKLGCDDLFEKGYIRVVDGKIYPNSTRTQLATPALSKALELLNGLSCKAWSTSSAPYFNFHCESCV